MVDVTVPGSATPAAAVVEGLTTISATLIALVAVDLHQLPGTTVLEVLDAVEKVKRQSEALGARALAVIEADGTWSLDGARSMAAWYRARTGKHQASAAREIRQARALRDHLPQTAQALAAGEISIDHASALVRHTTGTEARRETLKDPDAGGELLLEHARGLDASSFTHAAARWAQHADPDAANRAYREDTTAEEFYLSETTDGYVPGGWLSKASGKLLQQALDARIGVPAKGDRRRPSQRRASALTGLAQLALDSGTLRPGARIRPHLAITVPFDTLQHLVAAAVPDHEPTCRLHTTAHEGGGEALGASTGAASGEAACDCSAADTIGTALDPATMALAEPATFDDGAPLAPALLARLACAGTLHRVIFGPGSEVLDVGREHRIFTSAQTRAVIARDQHCQYPDCNAPPGEGEIHHSIWWWAHHGTTTVKHGVLLCWYHHDYVHAHTVSIKRAAGRWTFTRPDGTLISPRTDAAADHRLPVAPWVGAPQSVGAPPSAKARPPAKARPSVKMHPRRSSSSRASSSP